MIEPDVCLVIAGLWGIFTWIHGFMTGYRSGTQNTWKEIKDHAR